MLFRGVIGGYGISAGALQAVIRKTSWAQAVVSDNASRFGITERAWPPVYHF